MWPSFELTQDPSREPSAIDLQAKDWRTDELHLKHTGKRPFRERLFVGFLWKSQGSEGKFCTIT
jgi:hypothetical protein